MNSFEKRLQARLRADATDLAAATPGVVIGAWERGRLKGVVRAGETYQYYDLASLTKIIFAATASLHYFSTHRAELRRPVCEKLPWFRGRATPFHLLTHTAGLEWWLPMYQKLRGPIDPVQRWAQMEQALARLGRRKSRKAVYSDPDLWLMGAFLREAAGFELHDLWLETADRVGMKELFFHPRNKPRFARALYAPTERCPWRQRVMRAEVHDENAWALGGVSTHAGLFGSLEGVASWGLELRRAWRGDSHRFGTHSMVKYFTGRRIPRTVGDWGLGFMKPSRPASTAGRHFSVVAFGHTGFTGTSFWFDPRRDLMVIILSNRIHPTRDNREFLALRPRLHDFVAESL